MVYLEFSLKKMRRTKYEEKKQKEVRLGQLTKNL